MLFRRHVPASLAGFVQDFWLYDGYAPGHRMDRIVPSGTFELVINLREDEFRIYDPRCPERCERHSGAMVSGAYSRPFLIDTAEDASVLGVHFHPGGAFPFLGVSAAELADGHIDLEQLWGADAAQLRERLCEATVPEERFVVMEQALLRHRFRALERHYAVDAALDALARGRCGVQQIAADIGISHRRFAGIFAAQVGVTPKLFSRICRFHLAKQSARPPAPDWCLVAADCGYYDQSHLIRDFSLLCGLTPEAYARHQRSFAHVHIKRNHVPVAE